MTMGASTDAGREEPERILLVDDNPTNLQVLFQTLNGQGYKLLVAKSGEAALDIARKVHPQLILLDIMMPGLNGYQVCEQLKGDPDTRDAAVIFLSALDDTKDKVRGFELGAVDYVSKPFQGEEVIARVNTHLTIMRLQRKLAHANERMRRDLEAAARVQRSLLPAVTPETDTARFAWRYHPCDQLAGDSLSLFSLGRNHVGMYVLDVTGHGVASSLLSVAVARSLIPRQDPSAVVLKVDDTGSTEIVPPAEVLARLNALYPMSSNANFYFTIVYGVLDIEAKQFHFAAAGHHGPLHVAADGTMKSFAATGIPVGLLEEATYEQSTVDLTRGDRVYLYSDGIYEEKSADNELLGEERFYETLRESRNLPLEESVDAAIARVHQWSGRQTLADDVAILALESAY